MCNLNCEYCYASGGNYNSADELMSQQSARIIVEKLKDQGIYHIRKVDFFGGEPTLNSEIIMLFVEEMMKASIICDNYSIVTNGQIIDKTFIEFMKEHEFSIHISLDGEESINDILRGEGSYVKTQKFIEYLDHTNYPKGKLQLEATYTHIHENHGITREKLE